MSKPIVRVFVAALISLGILAAVSPSVQARMGSVLRKVNADNAAYVVMDTQALDKGSLYWGDSSHEGGGRDCGSDPSADY